VAATAHNNNRGAIHGQAASRLFDTPRRTAWSLPASTPATPISRLPSAAAAGRMLGNYSKGAASRGLCSPLSRAYETCTLVGYGAVAERSDDLKSGTTVSTKARRRSISSRPNRAGRSGIRRCARRNAGAGRAARTAHHSVGGSADGDTALFARRPCAAHFDRLLARPGADRWPFVRPGHRLGQHLGLEHATRVLRSIEYDLNAARA